MSAQVGARTTLSPQPKALAASDVRTRPTAESDGALAVNCRLRARRAPSGGLGASRAAWPRSRKSFQEHAAHERAAEGPLLLLFQPGGGHAAPRAFLGTSPKTSSRARFFFYATVEAISLKISGTLGQVVISPK